MRGTLHTLVFAVICIGLAWAVPRKHTTEDSTAEYLDHQGEKIRMSPKEYVAGDETAHNDDAVHNEDAVLPPMPSHEEMFDFERIDGYVPEGFDEDDEESHVHVVHQEELPLPDDIANLKNDYLQRHYEPAHVTIEAQLVEIENSNIAYVTYLTSSYSCPSCDEFAPKFNSLVDKYNRTVVFAIADVANEVAYKYFRDTVNVVEHPLPILRLYTGFPKYVDMYPHTFEYEFPRQLERLNFDPVTKKYLRLVTNFMDEEAEGNAGEDAAEI